MLCLRPDWTSSILICQYSTWSGLNVFWPFKFALKLRQINPPDRIWVKNHHIILFSTVQFIRSLSKFHRGYLFIGFGIRDVSFKVKYHPRRMWHWNIWIAHSARTSNFIVNIEKMKKLSIFLWKREKCKYAEEKCLYESSSFLGHPVSTLHRKSTGTWGRNQPRDNLASLIGN